MSGTSSEQASHVLMTPDSLTPVVERIGRPFFEATHVLGHRLADVEPCGAPARDAGDGQPSDVRWPAPPEDDVPDADGKHYYPRAVVAGETIQCVSLFLRGGRADFSSRPGDVVEVFGEWNVGRTTRARERDELERLLKEGSPSYVPRRNSQTEVWMMLVRYLYEDADGVGHVHGSWFEKVRSSSLRAPSRRRRRRRLTRCSDRRLHHPTSTMSTEPATTCASTPSSASRRWRDPRMTTTLRRTGRSTGTLSLDRARSVLRQVRQVLAHPEQRDVDKSRRARAR